MPSLEVVRPDFDSRVNSANEYYSANEYRSPFGGFARPVFRIGSILEKETDPSCLHCCGFLCQRVRRATRRR